MDRIHPPVEQVLDEGHVLLGVHHVQVVVRGDGAVDIFPAIAKGRDTSRARLRRDLYDPSDTAWAVARGLRRGGKDTYRGDVLSTQTWHETCSDLLGVCPSEGLQATVVATEDDAIEHPQWASLPRDRGSPTARGREDHIILPVARVRSGGVGLRLPLLWGLHWELYIHLWLIRHDSLEDLTVEDELKGLTRLELDDVESLLGSCHAATSLLYDDLDFREHRIRSISDAPCDQDFLR